MSTCWQGTITVGKVQSLCPFQQYYFRLENYHEFESEILLQT